MCPGATHLLGWQRPCMFCLLLCACMHFQRSRALSIQASVAAAMQAQSVQRNRTPGEFQSMCRRLHRSWLHVCCVHSNCKEAQLEQGMRMTDRPDVEHCCRLGMLQTSWQHLSQGMPCYSDTSASIGAAQSIGREASSAQSCLRWLGGPNADLHSNAPAHCSHVFSTAARKGFLCHSEQNYVIPSILCNFPKLGDIARLLQASK